MSLSKIALYMRTIRWLRPIQLFYRIRRQFSKVVPVSTPVVNVSDCKQIWVQPLDRPDSQLDSTTFGFLNQQRTVAEAGDWNKDSYPKLWLYNLHYHDGLLALGTNEEMKWQFVQRWMEENPFGLGNGWEPYPLSLRIVNWIKWRLSGGFVPPGLDDGPFQQVHALSQQLEYHLLGNHLFANAKALVFGGLYFEGPYADRWLSKGLRILREQLHEQFLPDGGHFELSTTYQATLTEDLLDLINILRTYGHDHAPNLVPVAEKALSWLQIMTRPDGLPPLFNDAAYRISPTLSQLTEYAGRLGVSQLPAPTASMVQLPESGYFRYLGREYSIWCDAGQIGPDYIPGHAHCDMLSFELFAQGSPIIVDTGTSTYEKGGRRMTERGTAAHNTVQVDVLEQSEIWHAFRVARRAQIVCRETTQNSLSASMVNYNKAYTHHRKFDFCPRSVVVKDSVSARKSNANCVARFHFHPEIEVKLHNDSVHAGGVALEFDGALNIVTKSFDYAPEFNKTLPATCVEISFHQHLTTKINL